MSIVYNCQLNVRIQSKSYDFFKIIFLNNFILFISALAQVLPVGFVMS